MSRGKISELIEGGDVRLNWKACEKGSVVLKSGDTLTVRGKGRVVVGAVEATKKDKFSVTLQRYL